MLLNWDTEAHCVFGGFAGAAETAKTATREGGGGGGLEPRKGEDFTFGTNERTNERVNFGDHHQQRQKRRRRRRCFMFQPQFPKWIVA